MSLLRRRVMMQKAIKDVPLNVDLAGVYGINEKYILTQDGMLAAWGPGVTSNYIPCKTKHTYEIKMTCSTWYKVCFYDVDKNFITSEGLGTYNYGTFQFGKDTQYGIPETAKYFRAQLKGQGEGEYYIKRIA